MTSRRDLAIASVDRYLANSNATLWGRAWDISDEATRKAAAEWLVDQMAAWSRWEEGE